MAKDVVVYTTVACPYCTRVKKLLDARGVEYREVDLGRDPEGRAALADKTGMMSFPQVLIDDELVGGFDQTQAADRSGKLAELLAA